VFCLVLAVLLVQLVRRLRRFDAADAPAAQGGRWVRPLAWLIVAVMLVFAASGYTGFAAFIAVRAVVAGGVAAALYLLLVIADAVFTDALEETSPRARSLAGHLGVSVRNIGVVGTLISAILRVLLVVLALVLVIGPWEVSTADLFESVQNVPLAIQLGDLTISFRGLLAAIVAFALVLLLTRSAQRWMQTQLLPRTSIEPSLQLSIATIFGYGGAIVAVMTALSALGVDLQKIALIAGALSVGIGFGLQSIVSNFVSGLILLAERPIRVGDSVVIKGEEGWVRRIRVRATEIETYDRASVIIPNSELITGVVKNWTHANTMGRIVIKVEVADDSDPEQVRGILDAIAKEHPQVLKVPPPRAFFTAFGDGLAFELRCVVDNVDNGLAVKSDMHFAILARLKSAGIKRASPQRDVTIRQASEQAA
jgi:small-conductance mechanosensitive channel